jgi:tetratricopeptide (TPR) repeat protein
MKLFLLLAFLIPLPSHACLWMDGTSIDGHHVQGAIFYPARALKRSLAQSPEERLHFLMESRGTEVRDDPTTKEADGVEKVLTGRYPEALEVFKKLETDHPGRYGTAVNMGTTYELMGELDSALFWISTGIRRNPESHDGTEWLHVAIIKAELKLKEDPGYLAKHHVIELPESMSWESTIQDDGNADNLEQIGKALEYQLSERILFIKPPNPVVADLLYTLGMLEAATNALEPSIELLEMSRDYGFHDTALISGTLRHFESLVFWRRVRQYGVWVLVAVGFIGFLVFAYRKRWFFLTRSAHREHLQRLSRPSA